MVDVPFSLVAPVRLSPETPGGLFLTYRAGDPPMFAFNWDGKAHLIHLEGSHAFSYFPIEIGYPARGLLITDVEFEIDVTSRIDAVNVGSPMGALVVENGQWFVSAVRAGDPFANEVPVPLSITTNAWSKDEKVAFLRWTVAARDGDSRIKLWPNVDLSVPKKK